jgi:hypothetical protein
MLCYTRSIERVDCAFILDLNRNTVAKIYDDIDSLIHANISRHPIQFS